MSSVARCERLFLFDVPPISMSPIAMISEESSISRFMSVSSQAEAKGSLIRETRLPVMPFKLFELGHHVVADGDR
jgi:hypothetical protein